MSNDEHLYRKYFGVLAGVPSYETRSAARRKQYNLNSCFSTEYHNFVVQQLYTNLFLCVSIIRHLRSTGGEHEMYSLICLHGVQRER